MHPSISLFPATLLSPHSPCVLWQRRPNQYQGVSQEYCLGGARGTGKPFKQQKQLLPRAHGQR